MHVTYELVHYVMYDSYYSNYYVVAVTNTHVLASNSTSYRTRVCKVSTLAVCIALHSYPYYQSVVLLCIILFIILWIAGTTLVFILS